MHLTASRDLLRLRYRTRRSLPLFLWLAFSLATRGLVHPVGPNSADIQRHNTQAELGRALFSDKNLSRDRTVACASCHVATHGFADPRALSQGVGGTVGTRNAPSLLDVGAYRTYFWDGRAASLEEQVKGPLLNPTEMGLASDAELIQRVLENAAYRESFRTLNGRDSIKAKDVARAIVAYERTLGRKPTALERFLDGDHAALAPAAQRGLRLFTGKAGCASCHKIEGSSRPLTDNLYHTSSLGLRAMGPRIGALIEKLSAQSAAQRTSCIQENPECAALGRFAISLDPKDVGAFRTPSLRAVSHTAPYMHDGSVATLEEALDLELYYQGANRGYPVILSDDERQDLLFFLKQL